MRAAGVWLFLVSLVATAFALTILSRAGQTTATGVADHSITSPDVTSQYGTGTSLVLDASGNPVLSYGGVERELKVMHCNDPNCEGGNESITAPDGDAGIIQSPSLVLDASGFPVVAYYDEVNEDLKLMHCNDPNCLGGDESVTSPDTAGEVGWVPSLKLDASGYPLVAYLDGTNRHIKVMHCNDPNCLGGDETITSPDTVGDLGGQLSMALDADGHPVVSYFEQTGTKMAVPWGNLKILHCGNADCTAGNAISSPFGGTFVRAMSLVIDAGGNPVVSFFGAGLHVLHCSDPNCEGGDERVVDLNERAGSTTSMVLDAMGYPVVAYSSPVSILHCRDADCANGMEVVNVLEAAAVTTVTMALDAAGQPVVAYGGVGEDHHVRVVHCSDSDCTNKLPTPSPVSTSGPVTVAMESLSMDVGETGSVSLDMIDMYEPGLGSWTIDVSFDSLIVDVIACTGLGTCNPELDASTARIAGATTNGLVDDWELGVFTFVCLTEGTSELSIDLVVFSEGPPDQRVTPTVTKGAVTCTPGQAVGDTSCDGSVDPLDAALILQFSAGMIGALPCPNGGDTNGDGITNPLDATLILQLSAGLIDGLEP